MATLQFANNATTTIAGAISNSATSVNLAPGSGARFPTLSAGQTFIGTFTDAATGLLTEIVQVTARSGDTLTIVRAQEGTTGLAWNAGDIFANLWTAGQASAMAQGAPQMQKQVFTASGTFTAPAGITALEVFKITVIGGGGGGGGGQTNPGGGGGGGGTAIFWGSGIVAGNTVAVTIGGSGGGGVGTATGGTGGASTAVFSGTTITGNGGVGGTNAGTGGAGGTAVNGTINSQGQGGSVALPGTAPGGGGGSSTLGGGAAGASSGAGGNYGGGGAGGSAGSGGGAGAPGLVIVEWLQ